MPTGPVGTGRREFLPTGLVGTEPRPRTALHGGRCGASFPAMDEPLPTTAPDPGRLLAHVRALEGVRHPVAAPETLEAALVYSGRELERAGCLVERVPYTFRGGRFENLVGRLSGSRPELPRVLVGAHVDTVAGSPGADDNASGVAVLLEVARLLAPFRLRRTVEFVVFTLEERQGWTYRVGSRRWAAAARRGGIRYAGALILEMVGYRDRNPGTQKVPFPLRWHGIPDTGDFLAAVGDGGSRHLLSTFAEAARESAPDLPVVTLLSPLRGWLVWATRRSDNASFWSEGYPALMLTDTAFLRNPHYHRSTDRVGTLDAAFMASVTAAVTGAVRRLGGSTGVSAAPGRAATPVEPAGGSSDESAHESPGTPVP